MKYENLIISEAEDILTLTISRPKALNALNNRTMEELNHFFSEDAPLRKNIIGIIITGSGEKAFVAGADIKEFISLDNASGTQMSLKGQETFFLIERFSKPVIAAINGFALGGGCELAMSCHLRIASENARLGQPEVNLGIIPGYGGTQRLIQYIGKGKAMELLMTADMLKADEALQLGLLNHVVLADQLMDKAKSLLKKIAAKGPVAIAKIIECVNGYFSHSTDGFVKEVQDFGHTAGTSDFKEGINAFVEKRTADFKGK